MGELLLLSMPLPLMLEMLLLLHELLDSLLTSSRIDWRSVGGEGVLVSWLRSESVEVGLDGQLSLGSSMSGWLLRRDCGHGDDELGGLSPIGTSCSCWSVWLRCGLFIFASF